MSRVSFSTLALCASTLLASCSGQQQQQAQRSTKAAATAAATQAKQAQKTLTDAALAAKVSANILAQAGINAASVKPSVHDGAVTLSGTVSSPSVKTTILDTVRKTSGVQSVIDRIQVKP
jgi:osmotically-inducible protein OsmY